MSIRVSLYSASVRKYLKLVGTALQLIREHAGNWSDYRHTTRISDRMLESYLFDDPQIMQTKAQAFRSLALAAQNPGAVSFATMAKHAEDAGVVDLLHLAPGPAVKKK